MAFDNSPYYPLSKFGEGIVQYALSVLYGKDVPTRTDAIKATVLTFLEATGNAGEKTLHAPGLRRLASELQDFTESWRLPLDALKHPNHVVCFHSAAMAELSYPEHRFEVKFFVAAFTWFMLYIDDSADVMATSLMAFQERYLAGKTQVDPVLGKFAELLLTAYEHWEPLTANSLIAAALEYVTGTALEAGDGIRSFKFDENTTKFSYFLRMKTGVAQAYTMMLFPKQENPHRWDYMPSVADISFFVDLTNDVLSLPPLLSFHKEELAGEDTNYIHNRARCDGVKPLAVLQNISIEAINAAQRASRVLDAKKPAGKAWRLFQRGFVGFHTTQSRYRMAELGLDWKLDTSTR
ncbi:hypothetical protein ONZ45_g4089 [Pleurotus djamor]|nr:hypothetical protein ONZ45_g4089 [Pleurotus djamor]